MSSEQKAVEVRLSVEVGADEVERVIHIGAALEREWDAVEADVRAVRRAIPDAVRKVPTLTCFLTEAQKREATAAVVRAGAEFVKTSTGFGTGGATLDDVRLMAEVIAGLGAQERVQLGGPRGRELPFDARICVEARLLQLLNAPMSPVTTTNVNLRSGPAAQTARLVTLPQVARVTLRSCAGGGCQVTWQGHARYVAQAHLA